MNIFLLIINSFKNFYNIENIFMFAPEIFLSLGITFIFVKNIFFNFSNANNSVNKLCLVFLFITLLLTLSFNLNDLGFLKLSNALFFYNNLKVIIIICSIFIFLIAKSHSNFDKAYLFKFYILCMLSTLGMLIIVSSKNLISLYLAIELHMIPIYFLCKSNKLNIKSSLMLIKFFSTGFLSSIVILFGMFLIYGHSSFSNFNDIKSLFITQIDNEILIGFIILLFGIIFKMFLTPNYMSLPDLFESSPIPTSLFIATSSFLSFIGALSLCTFSFMDGDILNWKRIFLILSVFSIFTGALGMFLQKNIKSFLGYFCIASAGYILLSVSLMSHIKFENILLYLMNYVFLLFGFFLIIILLKKDGKSIKNFNDLSDLSSSEPLISLALLIFLFSMSGIPPFSGFFSKWFVFISVIENNNIFISLLVILSSFLIIFSCLKIINIMYFKRSEFLFYVEKNNLLKFLMLLCLTINSFMFIIISPLFDEIMNFSYSLF